MVLSFALYVWAAFDVFHFQSLGALFVKIAANGLLTLLMWSLLQPRGTGAMRDLHACTTVLIGEPDTGRPVNRRPPMPPLPATDVSPQTLDRNFPERQACNHLFGMSSGRLRSTES